MDWPKAAKVLNVVIVVSVLIGAVSLLAYRNDTSTYAAGGDYDSSYEDTSYEDTSYDDGYGESVDDGSGYDDPGSTSSTSGPDDFGTSTFEEQPPGCTDVESSAYWPPTTEGPVVECPENPFGTPSRPLSDGHPPWIVVLESINLPEVNRVDSRLAELEGAVGGGLGLYDSRVFAGLRDPYWVIFAGPFSTREEANAFCSSNSNLDPCYPRQP